MSANPIRFLGKANFAIRTMRADDVTRKFGLVLASRDQIAGQNGYIHIGNKSFETVEHFKYLGTTLSDKNSIHEEIKSRLKSGNAFYHSVQNFFSSSLLSKNGNIKIYRTIILPVVLYGCESWSLTLRVFENKVLRRIFGPKKVEGTGEWRGLHNKELYALYSSSNIIWVIKSRKLRWTGHVARMGERRGAYRALVGKPEGRRSLRRPRRRWEDNIKMDLLEVGWGHGPAFLLHRLTGS
jgi:hypothetical protein